MRLMHISDLHLGKRVNEYSMLDDQPTSWMRSSESRRKKKCREF